MNRPPPRSTRTATRVPYTTLFRSGLACGGLFYPQGGWVHPPALCRWQASAPKVEVQTHHEVLELRRVDGQWQAWDGERCLASAPVVILASAAEIKRFDKIGRAHV